MQIYRFKVDKLIRDKLPQTMQFSGVRVVSRVMEEEEYLRRLKDKLLEEAQEVVDSTSPKEIIEELSDLLEVMMAVLKVYGMEFSNLQDAAAHKKAERGGFDSRIYSASVEIDENNPILEYYTTRPNQYPEIKS